ncbi:hypothetical protein LTR62_006299 [Meristemomyces frigidus]|uniref:DUF3074 domain-containing protein n=1 Tax=Meristemomyces frigidus TaxID=1508187 RepID=A0AAN7YIM2_9PEZI|nr:hypothetical protein LTR62_006299 [Meristemomyces frigidus]
MAELHEALKQLSPTQWSEIPEDDATLAQYMSDCFQAGELICNTVPPLAAGESFHSAQHHHKRPNEATSAKEMHNSTTRGAAVAAEHESLQKSWGKPYKFKAEQNPANVALYKMAGNDRHGAWFGRRSVHEGLGFDRFRRAIAREMPQSLSYEGVGAGAIRGLAADTQLEHKKVDAAKADLDVYQLSGQMPKPVTAREFVQLLMTTESGLSEKSAADLEGGGKHIPRSFMNVSRPISFPGVSDRPEFVRGQYESVELIREIPLHKRTGGDESSDAAELNPVEWIMVTRSDPGGGIPRFLVERGTPEAMLADVTKFLDWATGLGGDIPDPYAGVKDKSVVTDPAEAAAVPTTAPVVTDGSVANTSEPSVQRSATAPATQSEQPPGMFANIAQTLETGMQAYAPTAVTEGLHDYLHPTHAPIHPDTSSSDSSSDDSSLNSFQSATEHHRHSLNPRASGEVASLGSTSSEITLSTDKKSLNNHEKEVQKLLREREKLDRKLAKKREDQDSKLQKAKEKDSTEEEKLLEKHEKEIRKAEEKHKKEVEKLEQKKERELRKAEEKRRKKDDSALMSKIVRERDEFRSQLESYKRENRILVDRVEELERDVAVLRAPAGNSAAADGKGAVEVKV